MITASLCAAGIDRDHAAEYVVFLINLSDARLRRYVERCGHRVRRSHNAAALCLRIADARPMLRGLGMEANLDVSLRPGWVGACALAGWEAYAFVHLPFDSSAPDVGRA